MTNRTINTGTIDYVDHENQTIDRRHERTVNDVRCDCERLCQPNFMRPPEDGATWYIYLYTAHESIVEYMYPACF